MDSLRRVRFSAQLIQVLRRSADLKSRSTRAELAVGVIAALLVVPFGSLALSLAGVENGGWPGLALELFAVLPLPALLVRRLHDHGRSGWWVLFALFASGLGTVRSIVAITQGIEARIALDRIIWPLDWLAIVGNLAMVVLLVLPGTDGSNRFGPDPRQAAD